MDDLFDLVTALSSMPRLSSETVGATVGAELEERSGGNRFFHIYQAKLDEGHASLVELKEPGAGATSTDRVLTLTVREGVSEDDVATRFGAGELIRVMPNAPVIQKSYPAKSGKLSMLFSRDGALREITLVQS